MKTRAIAYQRYRALTGKNTYQGKTWPEGDVTFWTQAYNRSFRARKRAIEKKRPEPKPRKRTPKKPVGPPILVRAIKKFYDASKRQGHRERKKEFKIYVPSGASRSYIDRKLRREIQDYFDDFNLDIKIGPHGEIEGEPDYIMDGGRANVKVGGNARGNMGNMPLKEIGFTKLNFDIDSNNDVINNNCVVHYLKKFYGNTKGLIKVVKKLDDTKIFKVNELNEFLKTNNVPFKCYDQNLCLIDSYIPKKIKSIKQFIFIVSNEHIYPVTKKEISTLKKLSPNKRVPVDKIKHIDDLDTFVKEKIKKEPIIKFNVQMDMNDEEEFIYYIDRAQFKNTLYVKDKTLVDIYKFITKIYGFFPLSFDFKAYSLLHYLSLKNGLYSSYDSHLSQGKCVTYNDPDVKGEFTTIDQVKSFCSALCSLPNIPVLNSTTPILDYDNHEIEEETFYYVTEIKKQFYNTLKLGWTPGIQILGEEKNIVIEKYQKPILIPNPFIELIKTAFQKDEDLAKIIFNEFVGTCNIIQMRACDYYSKLTTSFEETEIFKEPIPLVNGLYCDMITVEPKNKFKDSLLPLSNLTTGTTIYKIRRDIKRLLKMDPETKIRSIATDSITFVSTKIDISTFKFFDRLGGYRLEETKLRNYRKMEVDNQYKKIKPLKEIDIENITDWTPFLNKNLFFDCYPGCGKTHLNLNTLIPAIENYEEIEVIKDNMLDDGIDGYVVKEPVTKVIKKNKYLILATKHSALTPYYNKELHAKVIHCYLFNKNLDKFFRNYDYVIFDEGALLEPSHYTYLFKNLGKDTKLIFMGDRKQLLPYGTPRNSPHPWDNPALLKLFDYKINMNKNYRNDYTKEQYDQMLINEYNLTQFETKLLNRYSNLNITMTKKMKNKINKEVIKKFKWVDKFAHLKVKKGGTLICDVGNLKDYPKLTANKIYNSSFYKIIDYNDQSIKMLNKDTKETIEISEELFKNNFDYGYAITSFKAQGMSIPYDKLGIWEWEKMEKDPRQVYTVLSRIQTKNI